MVSKLSHCIASIEKRPDIALATTAEILTALSTSVLVIELLVVELEEELDELEDELELLELLELELELLLELEAKVL